MRHKLSNLTLLSKLFLSFVCLTTVPLLIVGGISDKTLLKYSEQELSKSLVRNLEVSEQIFSMWNDEVCKQSLTLAQNSKIDSLQGCTQYNEIMKHPEYYQIVSDIFDQLEQITFLNSIYSSVTLYLENSDYIITSQGGAISKSDYIETEWLEDFKQEQQQKLPTTWRPTQKTSIRNEAYLGREYLLTYIYPIAPYATQTSGFVITNIQESDLSKLINGGQKNGDSVFIVDYSGNMVSNPDKSLLETNVSSQQWFQQICQTSSRSGSIRVTDKQDRQQEFLYSYYKSDLNDWIYISEYSLHDLVGQIHSQRFHIIGLTLLLVATGILLSFAVSQLLYHPIRTLTNKVASYQSGHKQSNDVTFLSDTFEEILSQVEKGKTDRFENTLFRLLGGIPDERENYLLRDFIYHCFCCVVICLDQQELEPKLRSDSIKQILSMCRSYLFQCRCEGVQMNNGELVLILNFEKENFPSIAQALDQLQRNFLEQTGYSFSAGVGGSYETAGELYKSYQQAVHTLEKRLFNGYGSINFYESEEKRGYFYPIELEKSIENNLRTSHYEYIEEIIHGLTKEIRENSQLSADNVYQLFNQLIGIAIKYLVENHISTQKIFPEHTNLYQDLSACRTLDEIEKFVLASYKKIIQYMNNNGGSESSRVEKIKEYISDHYHEDIELNTLAEYIGLSVSHMRRIFTEETGENILYFINRMRIDEGKRLLLETDQSITQIATNVGYYNKQSFNRFFKKYEGITPTEYRTHKSTK